MEQLAYISTPRAAISDQVLREILVVSRRNNARDGITGLLIAGDRRIMQVLEGATETLNRTLERIRSDQRHFAAVVLWRRHVRERAFPDWSMGFEQDNAFGTDQGLLEFVERHSSGVKDLNVLAELQGFARIHTKAA